jgi:hypothetical protein
MDSSSNVVVIGAKKRSHHKQILGLSILASMDSDVYLIAGIGIHVLLV